MTGSDWLVISAVAGAVVTVLGFLWGIRLQLVKQAEVERDRVTTARAEGFKAGVDSLAWRVSQLTTERDDARHDRDVQQARADEYERRYNNFRDRGRD